METLIFLCALILAAVAGYKMGKWSKEWEIIRLQDDNIRLSGEVHKLEREIDRANASFIEEIFPKNNTRGQENIKWG
jgi:hypothetical protein